MKKETNKVIVLSGRKLLTVTFLALALVFMGVSIDLHSSGANSAYAKRGGGGSKPSHSPSKSSKSKGTPSGGKKSNNGYAKANLAGSCKKVNGYCVTFSKNNCHNFYINGRHYGGSQSCRILDTRCGGGGKKTTKSNPPNNPPPRGGGGGGKTAPGGQQPNPNYSPFVPNPAIQVDDATGGPVKLKALSVVPPIVNNGHSCKITWVDAFESYDDETHCLFTGPGGVSINFSPASTTAPTDFTTPNLSQDSIYRLYCWQEVGPVTDTKQATCRINISSEETN